MNVAHRLSANMSVAIGGRVLSAVLGLAVTAMVTRYLGAEQFGIYRTASAWAILSCTLANLGLSVVCLREISKPGADIPRIVGTSLILRLVAAGASIAITAAIFMHVRVAGAGDLAQFSEAIAIAGIGTMATLCNELVTTIFQSALAQRRATLAELMGGLATLAFTAVAIQLDTGLLGFIGAATGGLISTFLASVLLARPIAPVRLQFDFTLARSLLLMGAPLLLAEIVGMATLRLDTVMLSLMSSPTEVGYYGVANKLREIGVKIPFMFSAFLMPLLVRAAADKKEFDKQLGNALVAAWIFAVTVILVMICFGDWLVLLMAGPDFLPSAEVVGITSIALAAGSLGAVLQSAVLARHASMKVFWGRVWAAVVAVAGYLTLTRHHGAAGTALSVAAGECVYTLYAFWIASPSGLLQVPWRRLAGITVVAIVAGVVVSNIRAHGGAVMPDLIAAKQSLLHAHASPAHQPPLQRHGPDGS